MIWTLANRVGEIPFYINFHFSLASETEIPTVANAMLFYLLRLYAFPQHVIVEIIK